MKLLVVANYNTGEFSSFIKEQMEALRRAGIVVDAYGIVGKGYWGYLQNASGIIRMIWDFHPDLIHAHYGLSGLCANLQRSVPVVTTYHGSDIHSGGILLKLSQMAMHLSAYNIFVSRKMLEMSGYKKDNAQIISCGVDLNRIKVVPRAEARRTLGLDIHKKLVLFSGSFGNPIKNYELAREAMDRVPEAELIELKGYSREQVNLLMNACDVQLTTSHRESGPLVVKEAMTCGTPVVSVDVGDVKEVMGNTAGCYIAERNPEDIADKIKQALAFQDKTTGRLRIIELGLDNNVIAKRLIDVYKGVIRGQRK